MERARRRLAPVRPAEMEEEEDGKEPKGAAFMAPITNSSRLNTGQRSIGGVRVKAKCLVAV